MKRLALAQERAPLRLGPELGRGGEGAVFAIAGQPGRVAKIYARHPDERKAAKLRAMAAMDSPALLRVAAWPTDLVLGPTGAVCGIVMPRVGAHRDVHELYSPKSRQTAFPEADFRFLTHVAANVARAFAVVHAEGHIVGDVNHGNLLVGPDGTVMLIDCDSFQLTADGEVFTCDVGTTLFTPPELNGRSFRGLVRTADHDLFGLAVLLFHLLFMGRHPFAGRYAGPGDMPIERAIAECRFPYGSRENARGMSRPPGTVPLEIMGPAVAGHFACAFGPAGISVGRPQARAWVEALDALKADLIVCHAASWHHHPQALTACPWCAIEAAIPIRLFGRSIADEERIGAVDVEALWQAIIAVPDPGIVPPLTAPPGTPPPGMRRRRTLVRRLVQWGSAGLIPAGLLLGFSVGLLGMVIFLLGWLGLLASLWLGDKSPRFAEVEAACIAWRRAVAAWEEEAAGRAFAAKLTALDGVRTDLAYLAEERQQRLAALEALREESERRRFLDQFRIDRANVPSLGAAEIVMLASYGIETAADIDGPAIARLPEVWQPFAMDLVPWRAWHERKFRFDPDTPIDRSDVDTLDGELADRRQALLGALQRGTVELDRIRREVEAARHRLVPVLEKAWDNLDVALGRRKRR